jgi:hypothetical protein
MISCTSYENQLAALQKQRKDQAQIADGLPGKPQIQEQLANLDAQIAAAGAALQDCRDRQAREASSSGPPKVLGKVTQLECLQAESELLVDEPYLLIASFDLLHTVSVAGLPVQIPAINVVKVGPWASVSRGESYSVGELPKSQHPAFWDTQGLGRPIVHPTDVLFLVAMLENDGSSPDAIRGAARTALEAAMANNLNRVYSSLVTTMISNLRASIETSVNLGLGAGGLNPDDLFDTVKHLSLTQQEVDLLNNEYSALETTLTFTQKNSHQKVTNQYTATFSFTV